MGGQVLVVDDDAAIRETIAATLELGGYSVETASNGREALGYLSQYRRAPPDLILLDLGMPVMDGLSFLDTYASDPVLPPVPIVILSAEVADGIGSRGDVLLHLKKPVDPKLLLATIERAAKPPSLPPSLASPHTSKRDQVADTLRKVYENLELRVAQRTAELSAANLELVREVSERKRAEEALRRNEEQLRQAMKMEAVGRLAGGVAHDFNNLLSVILSYAELLLADGESDTAVREDIDHIVQAARRATSLTKQLLAFSRQQVMQPRAVDVNGIIEGMVPLLGRLIGEDVELSRALGAKAGGVFADPGQLEQVVMNLAVNARDAMPGGGRLLIETADLVLDEDHVASHVGTRPGPHVLLAVTDTGVGMDETTRSRIFEPFFTTKEVGKGTGLGLATVYGIVKQSDGTVWVYSELGKGTTFKIYLPRIATAATDLAAAQRNASTGGGETILLVEDDAAVRAAALRILTKKGYAVLEAAGGPEAIRLCEERGERIHLMITDIIMPKMNGRELATEVDRIWPGVRVLFMSGYTDRAILMHESFRDEMRFLQKPFTPESLARRVREVLDSVS